MKIDFLWRSTRRPLGRVAVALLALVALGGCATPRAPWDRGGPRGPGWTPLLGAAAGGAAGAALDGPGAAAGGAVAGVLLGGMLETAAQDRLEAARREAHDAGRREERARLAEYWWAEATQGSDTAPPAGPDPGGAIAVPAEAPGGTRFAPRRRPAGDPAGRSEPVRGNRRTTP